MADHRMPLLRLGRAIRGKWPRAKGQLAKATTLFWILTLVSYAWQSVTAEAAEDDRYTRSSASQGDLTVSSQPGVEVASGSVDAKRHRSTLMSREESVETQALSPG